MELVINKLHLLYVNFKQNILNTKIQYIMSDKITNTYMK